MPGNGVDQAYLKIDYWNDFSFITMFHLSIHDQDGNFHAIGNIKIGFKGQDVTISTHEKLSNHA